MNIVYSTDITGVETGHLEGFFVGWPNPPDAATHLRLLHGSDAVVLARDEETGNVVGFITAITDQVLAAYIPHLEVLPDYQGQGIGAELVRRMLEHLRDFYMIDLMCDPDLQPYYERFGFLRSHGMVFRNYENQSGRPTS